MNLATIRKHLLSRYPNRSQTHIAIRGFLESVCQTFVDRGLADGNFEANLCSGDDERYWQRLSEALIAHELLEIELDVRPSRNGPDFLIQHEGLNIWVELICPTSSGIPHDWLDGKLGAVVDHPHEAILLRWTSAIKEKSEKLIGNGEKGEPGYLAKGVVRPNDAYVIAINGRLLRGKSGFASITGISQLPYAVEAVFSVGPFGIAIDTHTLKAVGSGHQHRPVVKKPSGSDVPADTFFDQRFRHISAVLAADIDECAILGNSSPIAVVHNQNSINPIPFGLLPTDIEFFLTNETDEEYTLESRPGRRSRPTLCAPIS